METEAVIIGVVILAAIVGLVFWARSKVKGTGQAPGKNKYPKQED